MSDVRRASSASARSSDHTRAFGMPAMAATACSSFVEEIRGNDAQPATMNSARTTSRFLEWNRCIKQKLGGGAPHGSAFVADARASSRGTVLRTQRNPLIRQPGDEFSCRSLYGVGM